MHRFVIHHFETIRSTNDELKAWINADEFTVITAADQTAGRGRRDRSWHSAPGDGLYMSVLLRPTAQPESVPLISLLTGITVAETLMEFGAAGIDIKWPNDVLACGKKISGVLIEGASAGATGLRLIVGIGVNINQRSFPDDLADTATSLALITERSTPVDAIRDALLDRFARWYDVWRNCGGRAIIARYCELSSYATGKLVRILTDSGDLAGETCGLDASGALQLRTPAGEIRTVISGEVVRLRENED
ncbi:MAG: biotin--[acetyl-CoA-carboxylase] ligase [Blastocatellales bacterium]|nr:biotin--[acetyl-CoA-carboxylase] ligase [Blastocatellales bacterium]